jgi:tryptophanyl-tRNA synthetase
LLSGELKELAAENIADFLERHQERRRQLGSLADELPAYRLTDAERKRAHHRAGFLDDGLLCR